jgi:serine protease AprX
MPRRVLLLLALAACAPDDDPSVALVGDERRLLRFDSGLEVALRDDGSYAITFDDRRQVEVAAPSFELTLVAGAFDPRTEPPPASIPALDDRPARAGDASRLYLVQFATQALPEYRLRLVQLGASVHQVVPEHAQLVRMSGAMAAEVSALPFVRWVGEVRPSWRLEPAVAADFAARRPVGSQRYWIHGLDDGAAARATLAAGLTRLGATVDLVPTGGYLVSATLGEAQLRAALERDDVVYVDRHGAPEADLDLAREVSGADFLEGVAGFTGQGVRGEVMDGNVFEGHLDFQSRPLLFHGPRGNAERLHGTATTGILFGDGRGDGKGRGLLPSAQGIFASYTTLEDRHAHTAALLAEPYRAVFQSNSWGGPRTRAYSNVSADLDKVLFDHDLLVVQSQSNAGTADSRPEAWAKNVLSVGGVYHYDTADHGDDRWARGASIGPAADGRIKPDLAHFYDATFAPAYTGGYADFGGTSGATPITAGYAGLALQMWDAGLFGPTRPGDTAFARRPHAATVKALLINTARAYPFAGRADDLARTHQGWGLADARRLYELRGRVIVVDETDVLGAGARTIHRVDVAASTPALRATLTWSDPPGVPLAARARVNDLDLRVVSPSGVVYLGNAGLRDGNRSSTDGTPDPIDTVENVWLEAPEPGTWRVEVFARELEADGHRETPAVDADYALVIAGATRDDAPIPMGHLVLSQVAYDTPGDDAIEEWVELHNPLPVDVDLSGWRLADDFRAFPFPAGSRIRAGSYLVVARDAVGYQRLTGRPPALAGLSLALGNDGDRLSLLDPGGATVDFVAWEHGWEGWETLAAARGNVIVRDRSGVDRDTRADWRDGAPVARE